MTKNISKLGSSASIIAEDNDIFQKTNYLLDKSEFEFIKKGINLLKTKKPNTIEIPLKLELITNPKSKKEVQLYYEQKNLKPWIKAEFITGQQLFFLAETILDQMQILVEEDLCFVDARPENYWLALSRGKLIDLGSIKKLTLQNILSFETDFKKSVVLSTASSILDSLYEKFENNRAKKSTNMLFDNL